MPAQRDPIENYGFDIDGDAHGNSDEDVNWGTDPLDPNDPSLSNLPDSHPLVLSR